VYFVVSIEWLTPSSPGARANLFLQQSTNTLCVVAVENGFTLLLISGRMGGAAVLDASDATWAGRTLSAPGNVSFSWEGVQSS
jgi:hypothetical protein